MNLQLPRAEREPTFGSCKYRSCNYFRSPRVEKRRITIPIPAGIEDGQTLRMSVGGNNEIFVTIRVEQSDYFRREGFDVHSDANISLSQSLLGGIIRIQVSSN